MLGLRARKKLQSLLGGRERMLSLQQGLKDEGVHVSMAQLCRWFEQPRRTVCYRPIKSVPQVKPELAEPIKALIEA